MRANIRAWPKSLDSLEQRVGSNPIEPVPSVRRTDTRSAQIGSTRPISAKLQRIKHIPKPRLAILARNLLAKHDWRLFGGNESVELGVEMPFVCASPPESGDAEGLAGGAPAPCSLGVGDSGHAEGKGPPSNPGKEMTLDEPPEVFGLHLSDASGINDSLGKMALADEFTEPLRSLEIDFIVIVHDGLDLAS